MEHKITANEIQPCECDLQNYIIRKNDGGTINLSPKNMKKKQERSHKIKPNYEIVATCTTINNKTNLKS